MEEEQRGEDTLRPERAIVYGRYTSQDGFRGWIQARSTGGLLYGDGAIELRMQNLLVRGWHRNWLGVAERVELVIPLNDVTDAVVDGSVVRFVWTRSAGRSRQVQIHAESNEDARRLFDCLPTVRSDRFERWGALSTLNDRVAALGNHPWVTSALVVLNLVLFSAWFGTGFLFGPLQSVELQSLGSNYGPSVLNGQWWRLLTSLFLHASVPHVLVNMWVLWNVGRLCERLYGSGPFALLYLGSGILACLARIAWDPTVSSIGASGAIFGVVGAFLAFAWRSPQQILVTVARSDWLSTAVFAGYSLITGWLNPVVDNAAHAGGLIGGFILGWILTRPLDVAARRDPPLRRYAAAVLLVICSGIGIAWHAGGMGGNLTAVERYFSHHQWYFTGEVQNLRAWEDLGAKQAAGTLRNEELASGYERRVLPFWNQAAQRLQAEEASVPADQQAADALLRKLVSLRQQWAHALIAAARDPSTRDGAALEKFNNEVGRTVARLDRYGLLARVAHQRGSLRHSPLVNSISSRLQPQEITCIEPRRANLDPDDLATDGPQARRAAGCRAQSLFLSGRYRELDDFITTASRSLGDLPDGESTLAGIFDGLYRVFESGSFDLPALLGRTSDWRYAAPRSINPVLVESMIFDTSAWAVRGHGYANTVSPESWRVFSYRVEMARASLDEIQERAQGSPVWYQQALDVGLDQSQTTAELRKVFAGGVAIAPDYGPLYTHMLRILLPRWQGSREDLAGFIETVTDKPVEPDFMLYARLYWAYSSLEEDQVSVFDEGLAHWAIVETGFDRLVERYPKSDFILNGYAKFACIAHDRDRFLSLRPQLRGRFSSAAWSDAVSLKSCDARF
jgi:membrane associated rhomboid family serine protease